MPSERSVQAAYEKLREREEMLAIMGANSYQSMHSSYVWWAIDCGGDDDVARAAVRRRSSDADWREDLRRAKNALSSLTSLLQNTIVNPTKSDVDYIQELMEEWKVLHCRSDVHLASAAMGELMGMRSSDVQLWENGKTPML